MARRYWIATGRLVMTPRARSKPHTPEVTDADLDLAIAAVFERFPRPCSLKELREQLPPMYRVAQWRLETSLEAMVRRGRLFAYGVKATRRFLTEAPATRAKDAILARLEDGAPCKKAELREAVIKRLPKYPSKEIDTTLTAMTKAQEIWALKKGYMTQDPARIARDILVDRLAEGIASETDLQKAVVAHLGDFPAQEIRRLLAELSDAGRAVELPAAPKSTPRAARKTNGTPATRGKKPVNAWSKAPPKDLRPFLVEVEDALGRVLGVLGKCGIDRPAILSALASGGGCAAVNESRQSMVARPSVVAAGASLRRAIPPSTAERPLGLGVAGSALGDPPESDAVPWDMASRDGTRAERAPGGAVPKGAVAPEIATRPASRSLSPSDAELLSAILSVRPDAHQHVLVSIRDLRRRLALPKEAFDAAVLSLGARGLAVLHLHDHAPALKEAERNDLVADGQGNYYVGLVLREAAEAT